MKGSFLFFAAIFLSFKSFTQHNFSTYVAHKSITEAIRVNNELIAGRTSFFEKQAAAKPLMFQSTKIKIQEFNRLSNNLSKYIEAIQKEVNTEQVLYEMLNRDFYKKVLFNDSKKLSYKGRKLKIKIDSLYNHSVKINVHKLSQLENFYNDHFKTGDIFYGFDENELDYFQYHFYDKSNYGIMMAMNCLLLDVKTFQLLYFGTVMSY
ncbi:hypothetical protein CXF68_00530 [Tenacibaculum sp. Bg11-29]|uniref:hypothetical protein n=1 Tax=Tenacibaculum sp. Bg11-29 TaxID=2058306 RepID=UPI000C33FF0F|nr:hypothetical protein [Tenacibaculum sp. Bg11-29]PKH49264.1 hypothetical protein CXF68_00530 [Tenacibaculum sp. Bg11-29]